MLTHATGTPPGICTVDSNASWPLSGPESMGTPITGFSVWAAMLPAKCAAMPAAAINTAQPRASAWVTYSIVAAGVRCADNIFASNGISNDFNSSKKTPENTEVKKDDADVPDWLKGSFTEENKTNPVIEE